MPTKNFVFFVSNATFFLLKMSRLLCQRSYVCVPYLTSSNKNLRFYVFELIFSFVVKYKNLNIITFINIIIKIYINIKLIININIFYIIIIIIYKH